MRQLSWRYGVHPVWRETIGYLVRTLTFRLGTALTYPATTIWHQASIALPTTLALVLGSALIGIAMGATLGIVAAWKAHSRIDRTLGMIADICRGLPALVTAVLAIWLFGSLIPGLLAVHGWRPYLERRAAHLRADDAELWERPGSRPSKLSHERCRQGDRISRAHPAPRPG